MGKEPDDIAREIKDLREETNMIVDELARRASPGYVAGTVAGSVSHRAGEVASTVTARAEDVAGTVRYRANTMADDLGHAMPEPVRRNPSVVGGALLGLLASLGAYVFVNATQTRRRSMPETAALLAETSADRARDSALDARDALYQLGTRVLRKADEVNKGRGNIEVAVQRREPSMMKRLVWVGLVSVMGALSAMLFQRLSAQLWRSAVHEEPPKK